MNTIAFKGIDGSSPLGILAALGAMRVISFHDPKATMVWDCSATTYFPVIETKLTTDACLREIRLEALRIAGFPLDYSQRKQEITLEQETLKAKIDKAQDAFDKAQATCRRKTADAETRLKREQKLQECADKLKALQEQWHDFQTNPLHDVKAWDEEQALVRACDKVHSILLDTKIKYTLQEFHCQASNAIDVPASRDARLFEFFAAFASDGSPMEEKGEVLAGRTDLSLSNGGGEQHLFKDYRNLLPHFNTQCLHDSLVSGTPWLVEKTNLNWSPDDLKNNALRSNRKEDDIKQTDAAMYAVAFLGLPAFPCMPGSDDLLTTGIAPYGKSEVCFQWPIWDSPATMPIILSLLRTTAQAKVCTRWFQSRKVLANKRNYFLPAQPVC